MNMVKRTWAEISLNAIEHNYNVIRNKVADDTKVCCVIKADGYGHGAVELSQIYEKLGADFFAVSNIDEGIEIRKSGSKLPIVILGYTPISEAKNLAAYNISQAVFSLEYAKELSEKCCIFIIIKPIPCIQYHPVKFYLLRPAFSSFCCIRHTI